VPKHPTPKRKTSRSKVRSRYASFAAKVKKRLTNFVNLVKCSQCGEKRLSHQVCQNCGYYRGKQVIKFGKVDKKIQKIKA